MLHIWVGRAGSGKSRRVLEAMERTAVCGGRVLLVPEHISPRGGGGPVPGPGAHGVPGRGGAELPSLASRVLARTGGLAEFTLDGGVSC